MWKLFSMKILLSTIPKSFLPVCEPCVYLTSQYLPGSPPPCLCLPDITISPPPSMFVYWKLYIKYWNPGNEIYQVVQFQTQKRVWEQDQTVLDMKNWLCSNDASPFPLLLTSFLCPLRVYISFMALMSYTLIRWSRDAVNSQFPFWFQFTDITVALWAWLCVHVWKEGRGGGGSVRDCNQGRKNTKIMF